MKKQFLVAGLTMLLALSSSSALIAQTGKSEPTQNNSTFEPGKFVDENKNGICDNYETRPLNGRGMGRGFGQGGRFVDANRNGICDYRENVNSAGRGPRFIDADKDGVCDNFQGRRARGWRHGWHGRPGAFMQNPPQQPNSGNVSK